MRATRLLFLLIASLAISRCITDAFQDEDDQILNQSFKRTSKILEDEVIMDESMDIGLDESVNSSALKNDRTLRRSYVDSLLNRNMKVDRHEIKTSEHSLDHLVLIDDSINIFDSKLVLLALDSDVMAKHRLKALDHVDGHAATIVEKIMMGNYKDTSMLFQVPDLVEKIQKLSSDIRTNNGSLEAVVVRDKENITLRADMSKVSEVIDTLIDHLTVQLQSSQQNLPENQETCNTTFSKLKAMMKQLSAFISKLTTRQGSNAVTIKEKTLDRAASKLREAKAGELQSRIFDDRKEGNSSYWTAVKKREREFDILEKAMGLLCSLKDSKGEPICATVRSDYINPTTLDENSHLLIDSFIQNIDNADPDYLKSLYLTKLQLKKKLNTINLIKVTGNNTDILKMLDSLRKTLGQQAERALKVFTASDKVMEMEIKGQGTVLQDEILLASELAETIKKLYTSNLRITSELENARNDLKTASQNLALEINRCKRQSAIDTIRIYMNQSEFLTVHSLKGLLYTISTGNTPNCDGLDRCSNNGSCIFMNTNSVCQCYSKYYGNKCEKKSCPGGKDAYFEHTSNLACSDSGTCDYQKGECKCSEQRYGPSCLQRKCKGTNSCNGHGQCDNDTGLCKCIYPYYGEDEYKSYETGAWYNGCEFQHCAVDCGSHGTCLSSGSSAGTCACEKNWSGTQCNDSKCYRGCSGRGECVTFATGDNTSWGCQCIPSWKGRWCQDRACLNDCNNKGFCDESGKCLCYYPYSGNACENSIFNVYSSWAPVANDRQTASASNSTPWRNITWDWNALPCSYPVVIHTAYDTSSDTKTCTFQTAASFIQPLDGLISYTRTDSPAMGTNRADWENVVWAGIIARCPTSEYRSAQVGSVFITVIKEDTDLKSPNSYTKAVQFENDGLQCDEPIVLASVTHEFVEESTIALKVRNITRHGFDVTFARSDNCVGMNSGAGSCQFDMDIRIEYFATCLEGTADPKHLWNSQKLTGDDNTLVFDAGNVLKKFNVPLPKAMSCSLPVIVATIRGTSAATVYTTTISNISNSKFDVVLARVDNNKDPTKSANPIAGRYGKDIGSGDSYSEKLDISFEAKCPFRCNEITSENYWWKADWIEKPSYEC